ncbi:mucin-13 [Bos taurus]|uniref:mucin-13 n=1 Tax=Bos taurus TaxID=9913 RepID=UPI0028CB4D0B|nr:mucin-13-like [Bos taurus]
MFPIQLLGATPRPPFSGREGAGHSASLRKLMGSLQPIVDAEADHATSFLAAPGVNFSTPDWLSPTTTPTQTPGVNFSTPDWLSPTTTPTQTPGVNFSTPDWLSPTTTPTQTPGVNFSTPDWLSPTTTPTQTPGVNFSTPGEPQQPHPAKSSLGFHLSGFQ